MNKKAADRKAKKNLKFAASIILCWIPASKKDYYKNYFISLLNNEQ